VDLHLGADGISQDARLQLSTLSDFGLGFPTVERLCRTAEVSLLIIDALGAKQNPAHGSGRDSGRVRTAAARRETIHLLVLRRIQGQLFKAIRR
jgi:hypothetical protein